MHLARSAFPGETDTQSRRLAVAFVAVSVLVFVAAVPFAQFKLVPVWPFIPIYQSALIVCDLVTAALLFIAAIVQAFVGLSTLDRLRRMVIEIRRGRVSRLG